MKKEEFKTIETKFLGLTIQTRLSEHLLLYFKHPEKAVEKAIEDQTRKLVDRVFMEGINSLAKKGAHESPQVRH